MSWVCNYEESTAPVSAAPSSWPAAACGEIFGMSMRGAGFPRSGCVDLGNGQDQCLGEEEADLERERGGVGLEGKQPAFWGASNKRSGRGALTAALHKGGSAPSERHRTLTPGSVDSHPSVLNAWPWCFLITWQTNFRKQDGRRETRAERSRMGLSGPRCSRPGGPWKQSNGPRCL